MLLAAVFLVLGLNALPAASTHALAGSPRPARVRAVVRRLLAHADRSFSRRTSAAAMGGSVDCCVTNRAGPLEYFKGPCVNSGQLLFLLPDMKAGDCSKSTLSSAFADVFPQGCDAEAHDFFDAYVKACRSAQASGEEVRQFVDQPRAEDIKGEVLKQLCSQRTPTAAQTDLDLAQKTREKAAADANVKSLSEINDKAQQELKVAETRFKEAEAAVMSKELLIIQTKGELVTAKGEVSDARHAKSKQEDIVKEHAAQLKVAVSAQQVLADRIKKLGTLRREMATQRRAAQ